MRRQRERRKGNTPSRVCSSEKLFSDVVQACAYFFWPYLKLESGVYLMVCVEELVKLAAREHVTL